MPPRVHHLAVVVSDLVASERFYGEVLGMPVVRRWADEAGAPRSVWLGLDGGAFLAVERAGARDGGRRDEAPGWHCVALAIEKGEREAVRARLGAAGHPIERASAFTLYVRDPDGNLVALSHWPDAADTP